MIYKWNTCIHTAVLSNFCFYSTKHCLTEYEREKKVFFLQFLDLVRSLSASRVFGCLLQLSPCLIMSVCACDCVCACVCMRVCVRALFSHTQCRSSFFLLLFPIQSHSRRKILHSTVLCVYYLVHFVIPYHIACACIGALNCEHIHAACV